MPFCFVVVGDTVYSAIDHKPKTTNRLKRLANVRATKHASVLVDHYDDDGWERLWWVRMDGTARVLDQGQERDDAVTALVTKYPQYREQRPTGPVLAVDVATYRAWEATGLG